MSSGTATVNRLKSHSPYEWFLDDRDWPSWLCHFEMLPSSKASVSVMMWSRQWVHAGQALCPCAMEHWFWQLFFFSSNILTFSCKFLVCVQFKTVVYQLSFQITHWSEILRWHRKKMVTHKQLTVGWCLVFKIEIRSSFYCIVLISSVCSLPFQGALCASLSFFMMLSPAKFLPFALGFSCSLDLPLFLLSTNYCLCILIKGGGWLLLLLAAPATILQLSKEHSSHRGACLWWILISCLHRHPLLSQKALCGLVWGALHPGGGGFPFCLGVCMCIFAHKM